jgi:hypothetical protein
MDSTGGTLNANGSLIATSSMTTYEFTINAFARVAQLEIDHADAVSAMSLRQRHDPLCKATLPPAICGYRSKLPFMPITTKVRRQPRPRSTKLRSRTRAGAVTTSGEVPCGSHAFEQRVPSGFFSNRASDTVAQHPKDSHADVVDVGQVKRIRFGILRDSSSNFGDGAPSRDYPL